MMRIITGSAKGKRLATLDGDATRPTSERIKGAIFSSIQFELEEREVLDLFAGSGQMGLEALSRGAARATFIDSSREAMEIVKKNAKSCDFFEKSHFLVSDFRNYIRKHRVGKSTTWYSSIRPTSLNAVPRRRLCLQSRSSLSPVR